jgi:hypothetical protein
MLLTNDLEADVRVWKEMDTLAREGYHIFLIAWDRKGIYPKRVETKNVAVLRFRRKAGFGNCQAFGLDSFSKFQNIT